MTSPAIAPDTDTDADLARRLRRILAANVGFTAVTALALVGAALPLGRFAGRSPWLVGGVGAALVPFALFVRRVGRSRPLHRNGAWIVAGADLAWVAGAAVVVAVPGALTAGGKLLLAALSLAVFGFGAAEMAALRWPVPAPGLSRTASRPSRR